MNGKCIKSSAQTKGTPDYYRSKSRRLSRQILSLAEQCEAIDPTGVAPETPEEKMIRNRIERMRGQRHWCNVQTAVATRILGHEHADPLPL